MEKKQGGVDLLPKTSVLAIFPDFPSDPESTTYSDASKAQVFLEKCSQDQLQKAGIGKDELKKWVSLVGNLKKKEDLKKEKEAADAKKNEASVTGSQTHEITAPAPLLDGSTKECYEAIQKQRARTEVAIGYIPKSDRDAYLEFLNLTEIYLKSYESGNLDNAKLLYEKVESFLKKTYTEKPVVAYRYNDILKTLLTTPVRFNIYKDSNNFYLAVGEGSFKTVATLSAENLLGLIQAYDKWLRWSQQCEKEKMEVSKPLGSFGGVILEFESLEEGKFNRVLMDVEGESGPDRLLSRQSVWMSNLNFRCLYERIREAPTIYQKNIKSRDDADRLK